jgi:rubrerythrin
MSPRSEKLNELLNDLEGDEKKEEDVLKKQNIQKGSGININIDGGSTVSFGNISIGDNTKPTDEYAMNCKVCGHVVAKAAKSCPNCGQPTRISKLKQHILLGVLLLAPLVTSPTPLFGFIH